MKYNQDLVVLVNYLHLNILLEKNGIGITPDVLIMAKGLGNGMPISAVGASKKLMNMWK